MKRVALLAVLAAAVLVAALNGSAGEAGGWKYGHVHSKPFDGKSDKAVFFAADGLRQDLVAKYAEFLPTMRSFLKKGVRAADHGLLTQAPPNTGAGWYTLATGAWPGVHGSTNNTFHINGQAFANRTAAFDPPTATTQVLQAETIAQSAERGGKKVAQVEWAGGRNGVIDGPTIDFRTFHSGRGVTTNFANVAPFFDDVPFITSFGLQFDHPDRLCRPAAVPCRQAVAGHGLDRHRCRRRTARRWRCACASSTSAWTSTASGPTSTTAATIGAMRYDRVLFSPTKNFADTVANLPRGAVPGCQGEDPGRRAERADRRHVHQGRGAQRRTCRACASSTPRCRA